MDELAGAFKSKDIIYYEPKSGVKLKHGGTSNYYVDVKKAYGYPSMLALMRDKIGERIPERTTAVAAGGYGGVPLATALSLEYDWNLVLVRDEEKGHGTGGLLDGYVPSGEDRVAIVDDVTTTGGSLTEIIEILSPLGSEITGCHVVVKRGEGDVPEKVEHLLKPEDLL